MEGDYDANLAHICLHKFKKLPHEVIYLSTKMKAFLWTSIEMEADNRKKEDEKRAREAKANKASRKRKR